MGHVFNIDGYQANDYFHINFGWGGSGNGYYHLNAINPGLTGYNFDQTAIINVVPQDYAIDTVKVRFSAHDAQITHPITVNISTDPILPIWNVDSYSLSIFYHHEGLQFASAEIGETISESGNLVVNSSEPGLLQLSWTGDNPLLGGGALLKLIFVGIETGSYLITPVSMDYAGLCVENLGEDWVSIHSTIESPAESSLRLSNALRVNYGETATLNLFTSYLPPSWDITHYEFNIDFPPDKISFSEVKPQKLFQREQPRSLPSFMPQDCCMCPSIAIIPSLDYPSFF